MIMVAVNNNPQSQNDTYLSGAKQAVNKIEFISLKNLAEKMSAQVANGSLDALLIADHGAPGVQGLGSGKTGDYGENCNFNSQFITVGKEVGKALANTDLQEELLCGMAKLNSRVMAKILLEASGLGFNPKPAAHVRTIANCIKPGGILFLCGCRVASNEAGERMVKELALYCQNSLRVVANTCDTTWTNVTNNKFSPALYDHGISTLKSSHVIGYMGERKLTEDELDKVLSKLVITAA